MKQKVLFVVGPTASGKTDAAVGDEIIVPLLDAQRVGFYVLAAVSGQKFFGIARLGQVALFVQKGYAFSYLVLHFSVPP